MRATGLVGLSFLLVACAAPAHAVVITLGASKDNTLYEDVGGTVSNGLGPHMYLGKTGGRGGELLRRALLAFDVSAIPAGSTVTNVSLSLNLSAGFGQTIEFHKVTRNWGEGTSNAGDPGGTGATATTGDATWTKAVNPGTAWTTPGGDFSATTSHSQALVFGGGYNFSSPGLLADVQNWVNNGGANFGWAILGNEVTSQTALRFDTKDNSTPAVRPSMTVTYIVPEPGAFALLAAATVTLLGRRRRRGSPPR